MTEPIRRHKTNSRVGPNSTIKMHSLAQYAMDSFRWNSFPAAQTIVQLTVRLPITTQQTTHLQNYYSIIGYSVIRATNTLTVTGSANTFLYYCSATYFRKACAVCTTKRLRIIRMRKCPVLMALLEDRNNCFIAILRCVIYILSENHDRCVTTIFEERTKSFITVLRQIS